MKLTATLLAVLALALSVPAANETTDFRVHEHLIDGLLPNVLQRAGYRTGIIGKLHVDPLRQAMHRLTDPPEWELYDLQEDPIEFQNRSGEAPLRKIETRLKTALATWQKETDDPFADPKFLHKMHAEYNTQK